MKENELMIDNYVECESGIFQVGAIREYQCDLIQRRKDGYTIGSVEYEHLKPIPLIEDWLKAFGFFENVNDSTFYVFPDNEYFEILKITMGLYFEGSYTAVDLKYVHQLQNLYFSLTGTQLTKS